MKKTMEADTAVRQIIKECGFYCRGPESVKSMAKNTLEVYRWLGPDDMAVTVVLGFLFITDSLNVKIYGVKAEERGVCLATISLYDPGSIKVLKNQLHKLDGISHET